ncbi:glycosyltransferase [Phenylobacterium sp.]|uniref:glycosyltransferase n=1 Tax=Phenylobacterium sp. TaxID=1871053 RepID=UPI0025FCD616|nr:glycosyltransferase family 2 protein [Phenylobacterium sp.]MBX3483732.1 glycosyltransferase family 2 protein [Phenylobacterium sp.]
MHVAIAIVGFRNAGDIVACLHALESSEHTDFEVVICENGGAAAFDALQAALPARLGGGQPVRIIMAEGNVGYAGGVNRAMAAAPDADAWWVLNPDTEAEPGALGACVRRLQQGDCEAVGCTIYLDDGSVQSDGGHWQWMLGRAESLGRGRPAAEAGFRPAIEGRQNFISGACALVGREFLRVVGPMREDYFLYCEEVEWFLRGEPLGMRLGFAPDARVRHHAGSTTGSAAAFREMPRTPVYLNERNRILLTRDRRPALLWIVTPAAALVILARYGRRRAWAQLGYAFSGWFAGIRGRRGRPSWIPLTASGG